MEINQYLEQLDKRIDNMLEKKEKYLSNRLYSLIIPILIFLLGKTFTTISINYLIGVSLGYGLISSVYNFVKYQYYRGIVLSDNKKKLEIEMLDNVDNLNEYFSNVKEKQKEIKNNIISYSAVFNLEIKVFFVCFLVIILNLFSKLIFFKMFGLAFAVGCLGDFLNIMEAFRQKLKLNDEYSVIGLFLEENKGIEEINNILCNEIDISKYDEKANVLDDYCIRNIVIDDDFNVIDMQISELDEKKNDQDNGRKNNTKVKKLTRGNEYRKK